MLPSVNLTYHFGTRPLRPFITGGYTALIGSHEFFNLNIGGGVNYWIRERIAVRVEFRNHALFAATTLNSYGLRVGLALR